MNSKEIAYAKHGAIATKSWDTYQALIKKCLNRESVKEQKKRS